MSELEILKYLDDYFEIGKLPSWTMMEGDYILEKDGAFFEFEFPEMFERELKDIFPTADLKYIIIKWLAQNDVFITIDDFDDPVVLSEDEREEFLRSGKQLPKKFVTKISDETISAWKKNLDEKRMCTDN